ncbi:MAG: 3-oxoacyl-[acyl-carrier-protein] reductase [Acidobacteriota bacterium]
MEFKGQIALITGAAQGIGKTIADSIESRGGLTVRADFREWEEKLTKLGQLSYGIRLDVTNPDQVKKAVKQVVEEFGNIDILVNNAGITRDGLLIRMKDEDWRSVLSTNLDGVFFMTREVLPRMMKKRYGRIVNISSVVGQMGNPGQGNYVASKAGVIGFTKSAAREVASRGITVNAVAPGYIATKMTEELNEKAKEQLENMIPLGRIGTSEDIANGVCFLASKGAGYITGQVLGINGGMYM